MPNNSNEDMQKATSLHQNRQLEKAEEIYKATKAANEQAMAFSSKIACRILSFF